MKFSSKADFSLLSGMVLLNEDGDSDAASCAIAPVATVKIQTGSNKIPKQRFEKDRLLFITVLIEGLIIRALIDE
ncbi:MAG: hypothetical protein KF746_24480 [Chitinophagaceae bacterium]|nr:hypothetical protein [Chitinophagaceae bacterium]